MLDFAGVQFSFRGKSIKITTHLPFDALAIGKLHEPCHVRESHTINSTRGLRGRSGLGIPFLGCQNAFLKKKEWLFDVCLLLGSYAGLIEKNASYQNFPILYSNDLPHSLKKSFLAYTKFHSKGFSNKCTNQF